MTFFKSRQQRLQEEAHQWVVKLTSGDATEHDADKLEQWRSKSDAHDDAYRQAIALWGTAGEMNPDAVMVSQPASPQLPATTWLRGFPQTVAFVVLLMVTVFTGLQLQFWPTLPEMLADYRTAVGEQRTIELPDGSLAQLNTDTALSVDFTDNVRRIKLVGGEASFTVVADATRPFIVSAEDGETTAVGTVFTVRHLDDDSVGVSCLKGIINVDKTDFKQLLAGQHVSYNEDGVSQISEINLSTADAWRKGMLIFQNRSLQYVVEEINRYRPGHVFIANGALKQRRVSGVFHLDSSNDLLQHIENSLQIYSVHLTEHIVILK